MIRDDEMVADGGRRQEWVTRNKKKKNVSRNEDTIGWEEIRTRRRWRDDYAAYIDAQ